MLTEFHETVDKALSKLPIALETVYTNDGNTDNTQDIIKGLRANDKRITLMLNGVQLVAIAIINLLKPM